METILKFNEEDDVQLEHALKGKQLSIILWDLDQWLRNEMKYKYTKTMQVSDVRIKLQDIMEDYDISFNNKMFE